MFYPAAMQECAGAVDAQVVVSHPDGRTISTRVFGIRVEPVVIGGAESEDGFTLFVDAIKRYEEGAERIDEVLSALDDVSVIKGEKGDTGEKGDKGEPGAPGKDGRDGANGTDGNDGVGIVSVEQTVTSLADAGVNVVTVTLTDGTKSEFEVRNGRAGSGGSSTGDGEIVYIQGEKGEKGDKGDPFTFEDFTAEQLAALKGEPGEPGEKGEKGDPGADGAPGAKGEPFTYADFTEEQLLALKGEKGDPGAQGEPGEKGEKGDSGTANLSAQAPLALGDHGLLTIDLGGYATIEYVEAMQPDLASYALLSDVQKLRQDVASSYVLEEDLPDFSTYAKKADLASAIDDALNGLSNLEELSY